MLTLLLAIAAQSAAAHELSASQIEGLHTPAYRRCMERGDAARGVTFAMLDCIADETRRHDELLNARYREVMARLPRPRAEQLRRLQRTWIRERDRRCEGLRQSDGGTAATLMVQECFMELTMVRANWIRARHPG